MTIMDFSFIQPFDVSISFGVQSLVNPIFTILMIGITFLGNATLWLGIAALFYWSGRRKQAFHIMNLAVLSGITAGLLKEIFARPRPSEIQVLFNDDIGTHSFPSGHSTLIGAMGGYFSKRYSSRNITIFFTIIALLVAFSRVYLGMHYVSDVIAGLILGCLVGEFYYWASKKYKKSLFKLNAMKDEFGMIAILFFSLIALLYIEQLGAIAAFLGFYAGFFLLREEHEKVKKISGNTLWKIWIPGMIGLVAIISINISISGTWKGIGGTSYILYFIAGFWVSYLYPKLVERFIKL